MALQFVGLTRHNYNVHYMKGKYITTHQNTQQKTSLTTPQCVNKKKVSGNILKNYVFQQFN